MNFNEQRYYQFACPQQPHDELLFEAIAIAQSQVIAELFVEQYRAVLDQTCPGVIDVMATWGGADADFDTVWDFSFGRAQRALQSPRMDPVDVAARLALRVCSAGTRGTWRAVFDQPCVGLRWDRWLLPRARVLEVESDGQSSRVAIEGDTGDRCEFAFTMGDNGWACDDLEPLRQIGSQGKLAMLPAHGLPDDIIAVDDEHGPVGVPAVSAELVKPFVDGLQLLADHAPRYLLWVERILRNILVCKYKDERVNSGSWEDSPGLIHSSLSDNVFLTADILVHEATHQYFHLLWRVGPVDDGSDTQLYYSPAMRMNRPLSRILIAYHAFANVVLFYRICIARGLDVGGYCARQITAMEPTLATLDEPLRENPALTSLGRAIYDPLRQRLADKDAL